MGKNKFFVVFGLVFFLVGAGMLVGAYFLYKGTSDLVSSGHLANGKVISLERHRGSDSTTYAPKVEFKLQSGERIEFVSSSGSNPPSYSKGEGVEVIYDPKNPQKAIINSFFSKWGAALIMFGMGFIFSLVGGSISLSGFRKIRGTNYAKKYGREVSAKVTYLGQDYSYKVNGKSPWILRCEWKNNLTGKSYTFSSETSWKPLNETFNVGDTVTVKVNMRKPSQHWVDLSPTSIRMAS